MAVDGSQGRKREGFEGVEAGVGLGEQSHELGLVANALPEAQGGGGERSAITSALIAEELAWGDLSIALAILSPSLLALPVADFGSEAQQADVLPRFTGTGRSSRSVSQAIVSVIQSIGRSG